MNTVAWHSRCPECEKPYTLSDGGMREAVQRWTRLVCLHCAGLSAPDFLEPRKLRTPKPKAQSSPSATQVR